MEVVDLKRDPEDGLLDAMIEWYQTLDPEHQRYICKVCSQMVNSARSINKQNTWFGPLSALQIIGALAARFFKWKEDDCLYPP
jgi:hypothetical protein